MTNTKPSECTTPAKAPFGDDDPRARFAKAVMTAGSAIRAVRPEQLDDPTPCEEFAVRQLLGHLVGVLGRVAAIGREEDPFSAPDVVQDVADDAWPEAWTTTAHAVQAAWTDDAALTRIVRLPWSELPGGETLDGYLNEITVHTWDLATATGQQPTWDPEVLDAAFRAIRQILPSENRAALFEAAMKHVPADRRVVPFAEAVEVPADAPLIDRLVAWNGRQPRSAAA